MDILVLSLVAGLVVFGGLWVASRETKPLAKSASNEQKGMFGTAHRTVSIEAMSPANAGYGTGDGTGDGTLYLVWAAWDADAKVWVARSDDVPGLVTEAETLESLDAKLKTLVPELLQANNCHPGNRNICIELLARRVRVVNLTGL